MWAQIVNFSQKIMGNSKHSTTSLPDQSRQNHFTGKSTGKRRKSDPNDYASK